VNSLLHLAIDAYTIILFVSVILSWFHLDQDHPLVRITAALTEPVLRPVRKVLPAVSGIDLSPLLVFMLLRVLRRVL
jgi:YggT family protein